MSAASYVLDTNTLIRVLKKTPEPAVSANFSQAVLQNAKMIIPQVVHYEMLRGLFYANAKVQEAAYRMFCARYEIGRLSDATWEKAAAIYAKLRKEGQTVGDDDILIGAFCIERGYTLVTSNTKHFVNMEGIKMVDWAL
ncbi:MAG: PIN domain-containing protein [Oscillospiraceae bacterium]|nr:PIN domain-containing protein [Oscillospiraceae bacterium]